MGYLFKKVNKCILSTCNCIRNVQLSLDLDIHSLCVSFCVCVCMYRMGRGVCTAVCIQLLLLLSCLLCVRCHGDQPPVVASGSRTSGHGHGGLDKNMVQDKEWVKSLPVKHVFILHSSASFGQISVGHQEFCVFGLSFPATSWSI